MSKKPNTTETNMSKSKKTNDKVLEELAKGLKGKEKKQNPIFNKNESFHKNELVDADAAFGGEKGKNDKSKPKSVKLNKPKTLEIKNTPKKDELDVKDKKKGTTAKKKSTPKSKAKQLKVKLLTPTAKMPQKGHPSDAGWDLFADADIEIRTGNCAPSMISTGVAIEFPDDVWGQLETRSSMAVRGMFIVGGIIDTSYRGEIKCIMHYSGPVPIIKVKKGEKIAQLVLRTNIVSEVTEVKELETTDRGSKGFGSTGK